MSNPKHVCKCTVCGETSKTAIGRFYGMVYDGIGFLIEESDTPWKYGYQLCADCALNIRHAKFRAAKQGDEG